MKTNIYHLREIPDVKLMFRELSRFAEYTKTSKIITLIRFFSKDGDLNKYVDVVLSYGYLCKLTSWKYVEFVTRTKEYYQVAERNKKLGRSSISMTQVDALCSHMIKIYEEAKSKKNYNLDIKTMLQQYVVLLIESNAYTEKDKVFDLIRDKNGEIMVFDTKQKADKYFVNTPYYKHSTHIGALIDISPNKITTLRCRR